MSDRETVIIGLEICTANPPTCRGCPYYDSCKIDAQKLKEDALTLLKADCHNCKLECLLQKYDELKEKYDALLKEQEPQLVLNMGQQISCKSGFCPKCGKILNTTCNKRYCGDCGQAVKWND